MYNMLMIVFISNVLYLISKFSNILNEGCMVITQTIALISVILSFMLLQYVCQCHYLELVKLFFLVSFLSLRRWFHYISISLI